MREETQRLAGRYLEAQLAGDRARALSLVMDEGVSRGIGALELHLEVIQAAQHEIGRLWQENRISIAQEHVATAISQLVLSHLYGHLPRVTPHGHKVLIACVEGELHDMGPRIAADFLEASGFDVRFLGASVPTQSLVLMAEKESPSLVALSASLTFNLPALRAAVAALRKRFGALLPIAVGGHAVAWSPGIEEELGLPSFGTDAPALVRTARRLLGLPAEAA